MVCILCIFKFLSQTKFEEYVDLFALPNKLVQPSERVMVAKQQTSCAFHHIVATDASMFVIDQRFPGHPVSMRSQTTFSFVSLTAYW